MGMRYPVIVLLLMFSHTLLCQSNFRVYPEVGFNISGFPNSYQNEDGNRSYLEKNTPVVSPLVGLWVTTHKSSHLFMSFAIQFNQSGNKFVSKTDRYNPLNQAYEHYENSEELKLSKLSFPIIIGYAGKVRNIRLNAFAGYRFVYYNSGKYTFNYSGPGTSFSKSFNPFNHPDLETQARKNTWQLLAGLGFLITQRTQLVTTYSVGGYLTFFEKSGSSYGSPVHKYSRSDIALSIKYLVSRIRD